MWTGFGRPNSRLAACLAGAGQGFKVRSPFHALVGHRTNNHEEPYFSNFFGPHLCPIRPRVMPRTIRGANLS